MSSQDSSPAPEEAIRAEHPFERLNREHCERLGAGRCMHCSGAPEISGGGTSFWRVHCRECHAATGLYPTDAEAVAAWNRRAGGEREAWQPIESAPKDGSEIILGAHGWSESGFWHDGSENYWKIAGWYAEMDRGNLLTAKPSNPTHWQPLPAPPRAALAGQTEGERNGG